MPARTISVLRKPQCRTATPATASRRHSRTRNKSQGNRTGSRGGSATSDAGALDSAWALLVCDESTGCLQATQMWQDAANICPQAGHANGSSDAVASGAEIPDSRPCELPGLALPITQSPNHSMAQSFSFHPSCSFQSKTCQWTSWRGSWSKVRSLPKARLPLCD